MKAHGNFHRQLCNWQRTHRLAGRISIAIAATMRIAPSCTDIERLLGADMANLNRIDSNFQTLEPGDRVWMTPERYLGWLPGQFWSVREALPR